ncbi:hypothetical protein [Granulicella arctica]|uniref:Uncharacterized protein n=1 Tax=Granulicella arctica TaxID=940613 RepID=A0A7Y9PI24_9BACT|nr:hypothetical protein [Granulicella arctica]NYF80302.1 hypothetical protein [Granulicella arctica]
MSVEKSQASRALPAVLSLHWGWLLIATIVEQALWGHFHREPWSLFNVVDAWSFIQAGWLRSVDKRSTALYWYIGASLMAFLIWAFTRGGKLSSAVDAGVSIAFFGIVFAGVFVFRRDMQRYFNEKDNVGLHLSPWMTLFFSTLYFQYHFHDIAQFKSRHPEISTLAEE